MKNFGRFLTQASVAWKQLKYFYLNPGKFYKKFSNSYLYKGAWKVNIYLRSQFLSFNSKALHNYQAWLFGPVFRYFFALLKSSLLNYQLFLFPFDFEHIYNKKKDELLVYLISRILYPT